jgi:putative peptidoglycan lipid II flippase
MQTGAGQTDGAALVRSSGVVAIGTGLSRISGLARTVATAVVLGTVGVGAAYNLANNTPNMIYDLLLGGVLSATLVPVLVANREHDDQAGTDAVLTVASVFLVITSVIAILLAPAIVHLYGLIAHAGPHPPSGQEEELATLLLRLFAPQVLFYGLATLGSALLNAHRRFAAAAFAPVLNNVVLICVLLAASRVLAHDSSVAQVESDSVAVLLLGLGTTAGIAAMALVLWPAITMAKIPVRWRFDLHHPAVRQVARLSGWTLGYVVVNQVTLFIIIALAFSTPGGGGVSAWTYAYQFFQLPYGVFTVSVMTAFTPELASLATEQAWTRFKDRFLFGVRLIVLLLLPATILLLLLARPVVSVLLSYGHFHAADARITASTVAGLAYGIVGFSMYLYVLRGFYALRDTKTPFLINLVENALTLVFAFVFATVTKSGVEGLAWAWSLAYLIAAVIAFVALRRRIGVFGFALAVRTTVPVSRMVVAAVGMAVVVGIAAHLTEPSGASAWLAVVVGGGLGLVVYWALLEVMRVPEMREIPRLLGRR